MKVTEDISQIKEIIQGLLKAKKNVVLYPSDNPIRLKIIEEAFSSIDNFLSEADELTLIIKPNAILYGDQYVYSKTGKDDNLALFFFKDGLREITFKKGFNRQEYIDLINIIITDFQKDMLDDDVVTLLWEREFEHFTYVVDEDIFCQGNEEWEKQPGASESKEERQNAALTKAFRDSLEIEENCSQPIIPLDEEDMYFISQELKQQGKDLLSKLTNLVFEILYMPEDSQAFEDTVDLLCNTLLYCLKKGDLNATVDIITTIKSLKKDSHIFTKEKLSLIDKKVISTINNKLFIKELATIIDIENPAKIQHLSSILRVINSSSLPYFIEALGELRTERGQKIVNDILFYLGKKDYAALAWGLRDQRWYVVKSILHIINQIGDKRFIEHIKLCLSHPDVRVRKEAVRTLGNFRVKEALPMVKNFLFDSEKSIRLEAVEALGKIKSESVKSILFYEIQKKDFSNKDFIEKKKFYHIIATMPDQKVIDFFLNTLKKKTMLGGKKNDETRACAAYALGVAGVIDALPLLEKTSKSKNTYLKSQSLDALKKIKTQLPDSENSSKERREI
jgi:hypothetical protein